MVQFASYLRRVLCKKRLILPRINAPNDNSWQCVPLACSSRSAREEWRALFFAPSPLSECLCSENWRGPGALNLWRLWNLGCPGFGSCEKIYSLMPKGEIKTLGTTGQWQSKDLTEHLLVKIASVSAWRFSKVGFSDMNQVSVLE